MKSYGVLKGIFFITALFAGQLFAGNYTVDVSESVVKWNGKKVTGEHYGTIDLKAGNIVTEGTSITSGAFTMDMSTLVSEDLKDEALNKRLVNHLKSDDFFSVEKHPVSTFILTNVVHNEGNKYSFTGNMTIKGITHPLTFEATVDIHNSSLEAKGKMEIDRTLYDIKFRSGKFFASLGDNLIYDTFTLDFKVIADLTSPAAVSGK